MKVDRRQFVQTRFLVVLSDDEVAEFVMQGVTAKLGLKDETRAKAAVHNGNLHAIEVLMEAPMEDLLAIGGAEF